MDNIKKTKQNLRVWMFGIISIIVITTTGLVYYSVSSRLDETIDQNQFENLIVSEESLNKYYQDQEGFEAHFVTTANIIKQDQLNNLLSDLIVLLIPTIILTSVLSYLLSKKFIEPIQETFDSKQRFMQDAAHELRNPLAAIKATVQNLLGQSKTGSSAEAPLKSIARQVENLIKLSNDLLFLEKADNTSIEELNITQLTQDVIDQLTPLAKKNSVKINFTNQEELKFKLNLEDYVILLKNLLSNSIKYSREEEAKVDIKVELSSKSLNILVSDNGIGIAEDELDRIGSRFFRASNSNIATGSGLGLSIVNKIADKYKGKVLLDSKLEKGTTVEVTLFS